MTVIFNGNIEITNVGDSAVVNFGNMLHVCPKSITSETRGSGGGSGAYVVETSLFSINYTNASSLVNQPSGNDCAKRPIKKIESCIDATSDFFS